MKLISLDDRRENLRICTMRQNQMNKNKPNIETTSKYKGVCFQYKKWRASISVKNKCRYLGLYESEIEAARAYDTAAKEFYGEFATINGV